MRSAWGASACSSTSREVVTATNLSSTAVSPASSRPAYSAAAKPASVSAETGETPIAEQLIAPHTAKRGVPKGFSFVLAHT